MPSIESTNTTNDVQDIEEGGLDTPQTSAAASNQSQSLTSKLVITSKRFLRPEDEEERAQISTRTTSGSKKRRLTPEPDTQEHDGSSDNGHANKEGRDGDEGEDEEVDPDKEVIIPVAEDYDSDESETGMADTLDKMRKTVEVVPHAPGAIIRAHLENFVTYTKVTFEPGPSLNMVIGPNGTGKSTLVCAICLGLGFGPEHLGRAKDAAEFVKNGTNEAFIEIELKGLPTDEYNPTIKRRIGRDGTSQYWINGKKQTLKAVNELTKLMNIQIDNLCQFLPQDRVVEFAGLGPVSLLRETQRAAAPPEVLKDHEKLKQLRAEEVGLEVKIEQDRQALSTLELRQKTLEREVVRFRERQTIQDYIQLLKNAIQFVEFQDIKSKRDAVKEEYRLCREQYKQIRIEQEPQAKQIEEAETLLGDIMRWLEDEKAELSIEETDLKTSKERIENLKAEEGKAESDLRAIIDSEKDRKGKIEKAKQQIARLERVLEKEPEPIDFLDFNRQLEDINKDLRVVRDEKNAIEGTIEPLITKADQKRSEIKSKNNWITQMNNRAGQRAEVLRRNFPDSGKVYDWIQKNKDKFTGPVYGPPIVECDVKNPQYQAEIEALFGHGEKLAFTCCNKTDFDTLVASVYGDNKNEKGMGLSAVTIKYIETRLEDFPRAGTQEQVQSLGFDGVALDFISGPPEVLSMLCSTIGLHRVGIAKARLSAAHQQAVKAGRTMTRWISGGVLTTIRRRAEYAAETEINVIIKPAQYLKATQIDQRLLQETKNEVLQLEAEIQGIGHEIEASKGNLDQLGNRFKALDDAKKRVQAEKNSKQLAEREYERSKTHLSNERDKLAELERAGRGFKQKVAQQEARAVQLNIDRVKAAVEYADRVREHVARYDAVAVAELQAIEAYSNVQHHNFWNQSFKDRLEAKKLQCHELKEKEGAVVRKSQELRDKCRDLLSVLPPEHHEAIQNTHSKKTVNELKVEIQQEEIRVAGIYEGNPNSIVQYETREKEINGVRTRVEAKEKALGEHRRKIQTVRGRWEPRIDQLVANISEAFSRSFEFIHCAGSVRIRKEGKDGCDYEKWAIEILVKFREAESMQVLTAQRQSGGERAVSTVFYLMALQSLARAPFRVVDEINQGMDPRNERLVHKRMVKIACKRHTSQYFLITPKLLVDLDYHERMKVLCINSGDWVQENHIQDFTRYLEAGRKLKVAS